MSTSRDLRSRPKEGRSSWWSCLWSKLSSIFGAQPVLVRIKVAGKSESKKARVAVPVKINSQPVNPRSDRSGSWQIYTVRGSIDTSPIQIVHSRSARLFSVIFQSPEGWLFWTGPKKKVFTRLGRGEIWTTPDSKVALIVANFIYSSRLPDLEIMKKAKRR